MMSSTVPVPTASFTTRFHRVLERRRVAVLVGVLLVWALSIWLASRAHTDNSTLAFFPDNDPLMIRMAKDMDMAPFSRLLLVNFSANEEGQATRLGETAEAVLRAISPHLARRAAAFHLPEPQDFLRLLPSLVDVAALRHLEKWSRPEAVDAAMSANSAALSGLLGGMGVPWIRYDPLNFRRIILDRLPAPPGMSLTDTTLDFPLSRDGRHVLLTLRPMHSLHDVHSAAALMDALSEAIQAHVPPYIRVTIVGGHRHSAVNAQIINSDIRQIVLLSLLGFLLIYIFLVRSLSGALWLLLTPLAAASLALAGISQYWSVMSGLALGFGASVLGIAEDYAVHTHFALRSGRSRDQSTASVLDALIQPLTQGFLLNTSGFAVLLFSGIPALRQLAAFAILTLCVGIILALAVLPLCPGFDKPPLPVRRPVTTPRFPRPIATPLCVMGLLCICFVLWQHVQMDASPRSLGVDVAVMREDVALLRTVWGGRAEHLWVVRGRDTEEALSNTRGVAVALRENGQEVDALAEVWPSAMEARANIARWEAFVSAHTHLAEHVAMVGSKYGFTAATFNPLAHWLTESPRPIGDALLRQAGLGDMIDTFLDYGDGKSEVRSLIIARGMHNNTDAPAETVQNAWDRIIMPPELATVSVALSPTALETTLTLHLNREQWLLPALALVLAVLIYFCFGEMRKALLAAVPALTAMAAIFSWLAVSGTPLTLTGMAALPLVLGLAIDHGVVMTHDMAHGVAYGVDRAIVTSSLTALTGMGLLAIAEHPALRSMGQIIFLGLVLEMAAALWLLPRLSVSIQGSSVTPLLLRRENAA